MAVDVECTTPGCTNHQHSGGLCSTCYSRDWREKHPIGAKARVDKQTEARRAARAEQQRQYYHANREEIRARVRQRYASNRVIAKRVAEAERKAQQQKVDMKSAPRPAPAFKEPAADAKAQQFQWHSADRDEANDRRRELRARLREQADSDG